MYKGEVLSAETNEEIFVRLLCFIITSAVCIKL